MGGGKPKTIGELIRGKAKLARRDLGRLDRLRDDAQPKGLSRATVDKMHERLSTYAALLESIDRLLQCTPDPRDVGSWRLSPEGKALERLRAVDAGEPED